MTDVEDFPVEVTLADSTKWLVYYRSARSYGDAITYVFRDIEEGRLMPAEDLDGVQRRSSLINMRQVVSVREAESGDRAPAAEMGA